MNKIKYVSFDVFDTLLKRLVPPEQLYKIIEKELLDDGYDCAKDFAQKRMLAEQTLKEKKNIYSISDIYNESYFAALTLEEKKEFINYEIKSETQNLVPCYKGRQLYEKYKTDYAIICISDMYISSQYLKRILIQNGYTEITHVIVSCDWNASKRSGDLYAKVLDKLQIKGNEIIHIGDAIRSDILNAFKSGIRVKRVKREKQMITTGNILYDFAYNVCGPLLYQFCIWLHENAKNRKIFFLSREGIILQKYYNLIFAEDNSKILYFSRDAVVKSVSYEMLSKGNFENLRNLMSIQRNETIEKFFERIGLDLFKYTDLLEKENIDIKDSLNEKFYTFANKYKSEFLTDLKSFSTAFHDYLLMNLYEDNIFVDIGWKGSMQDLISAYLLKIGAKNRIQGLYLGVTSTNEKKGFLFADYGSLCNKILCFSGLLEVLFMPDCGTVKGYIYDNGIAIPQFAECEFSNNSMMKIKEFQRGIYDSVLKCTQLAINIDVEKCINELIRYGCNPPSDFLDVLRDIEFYDNGKTVKLVEKKSILHFKNFYQAFMESKWKTAYLKSSLKISFPYESLISGIRKYADRKKFIDEM